MTISLSGHGLVQILHFLIPAYSTAELDFKASLVAVSPADVILLNNLIKSAVPPDHEAAYEALSGEAIAGGLSFLGLWSEHVDPVVAMTKIGISAQLQDAIIKKLSQLANHHNDFAYQTSVDNSHSSLSTTGQLSVVTVNVQVPDPQTGKLVTRTIIAPKVTAISKPQDSTARTGGGPAPARSQALPVISTTPLYHVP